MNKFVIIATLAGLACGIVARKLQEPAGEVVQEDQFPEEKRSRRALGAGDNKALVSLSWNVRGDLNSEELLELPYGARLMAEMTLWSTKAEPEELAEHWERLMESGEKDMNVLDHYMILWARRDPEGAHAHVQGGEEEFRCLWAIARLDAPKALSLVDPKNRKCLSKVLRAIGQTDPDLAMTLLERYPHHDPYDSSQGISDGLKDIDPALAVEFSARQKYFDSDHYRWWLAKDPKTAFAWGVANKNLASRGLADLVPMLLEQDSYYFEHEIDRLPTGKLKLDLLKAQVKHQAGQDPKGALELANGQEGPQRIALLNEIGGSLVHERPEFAHEIFEVYLSNDIELARSSLVEQSWVDVLVEQDPVRVLEASRRLESDPENEGAGKVERTLFGRWVSSDSEASLAWAQSQDSVPHRDQFMESYISQTARRNQADHHRLIELSGDISNDSQRKSSFGSIVRNWLRSDPEGLQTFIESPQATEEQRDIYQGYTNRK